MDELSSTTDELLPSVPFCTLESPLTPLLLASVGGCISEVSVSQLTGLASLSSESGGNISGTHSTESEISETSSRVSSFSSNACESVDNESFFLTTRISCSILSSEILQDLSSFPLSLLLRLFRFCLA